MTDDDRKALAEQILNNPLMAEVMGKLEKEAIDRCVYAPMVDHEARQAAAAEVRAIRSFRASVERALVKDGVRRTAPA